MLLHRTTDTPPTTGLAWELQFFVGAALIFKLFPSECNFFLKQKGANYRFQQVVAVKTGQL